MKISLLLEVWRWAKLALGWVLLVVSPLVGGPLPGPFGVVGFAAGLILVLRNSRWARRLFIRIKRRYPATVEPVRHALRPGANLPAILRRAGARLWAHLRSHLPGGKRPAAPDSGQKAGPDPAAPPSATLVDGRDG